MRRESKQVGKQRHTIERRWLSLAIGLLTLYPDTSSNFEIKSTKLNEILWPYKYDFDIDILILGFDGNALSHEGLIVRRGLSGPIW